MTKGLIRKCALIKRIFTNLIFLIGFVLAISAVLIFPWPLTPEGPKGFLHNPKGFIFGTSELLQPENTSIYFNLYSIRLNCRKVNVTVHINYVCQNRSIYAKAFFVLQVPFNVENVNVVAGAWTPEFFGGDVKVKTPLEGLSFIIIRVPKENMTFGGAGYIGLYFTIKDVFWKYGYYTYEFNLAFSNNFNDSIDDALEGADSSMMERLLFFQSKSARLSVERPYPPYFVSDVTPQPDFIEYKEGKTWYRWDIKSTSSPHLSASSVILKINDEDSRYIYDIRNSLTWFLFGLGIPLALSSFYLILQEPNIEIEVSSNPEFYPNTGKIAFYHLVVKNTGKTTAYECEVYISIKHPNGKKLFDLLGKWSRGPEPLGPIQWSGVQQVWPSLIPLSQVADIRPNLPESFCIIIKDDNEKECYAWNAHSYFFGHKNPQWKLDSGKYIAEIELRGGNAKSSSKFIIENRGSSSLDIIISRTD